MDEEEEPSWLSGLVNQAEDLVLTIGGFGKGSFGEKKCTSDVIFNFVVLQQYTSPIISFSLIVVFLLSSPVGSRRLVQVSPAGSARGSNK